MALFRLGKAKLTLVLGVVALGGSAIASPSWAADTYTEAYITGTNATNRTAYTGLTLEWVNKSDGATVSAGGSWTTSPNLAGAYSGSFTLPSSPTEPVLKITMPACNGAASVYYYRSVSTLNSNVTTDRALATTVSDGTSRLPGSNWYMRLPDRKPCAAATPTLNSSTDDVVVINMQDLPSNGGLKVDPSTLQMLNMAQGYASWQKIVSGEQGVYDWGALGTGAALGNATVDVYWSTLCYDWIRATSPTDCINWNATKGYVGESTLPVQGIYGFRTVPRNSLGVGTVSSAYYYDTRL